MNSSIEPTGYGPRRPASHPLEAKVIPIGALREQGEPLTEEDIAYRKNREESLQLCDDFQAFYAANAAYHLDL